MLKCLVLTTLPRIVSHDIMGTRVVASVLFERNQIKKNIELQAIKMSGFQTAFFRNLDSQSGNQLSTENGQCY